MHSGAFFSHFRQIQVYLQEVEANVKNVMCFIWIRCGRDCFSPRFSSPWYSMLLISAQTPSSWSGNLKSLSDKKRSWVQTNIWLLGTWESSPTLLTRVWIIQPIWCVSTGLMIMLQQTYFDILRHMMKRHNNFCRNFFSSFTSFLPDGSKW